MDTDWKDRIEKANALWERVNLLQEEIELIEKQNISLDFEFNQREKARSIVQDKT